MDGGPAVLDEALVRVSGLEFPPPVTFVSHAPMACEALDALGLDDVMERWVSEFEELLVDAPAEEEPGEIGGSGWRDQLGDGRLLPQWLGYFDRAVADDGWRDVVRLWVPRLMPSLSSALFHGVIRTSHAVRAVEGAETAPRRAELARALANWATWSRPGEDAEGLPDAPRSAALRAAASGARYYVEQPNIVYLHGVTGAMAVHLLIDHLDEGDARCAVAQLESEHLSLYGEPAAAYKGDPGRWADAAVVAAAQSGDPHQVKLVEACRRGFRLSADPAFVTAAETVTGIG